MVNKVRFLVLSAFYRIIIADISVQEFQGVSFLNMIGIKGRMMFNDT